MTVRMYADRKNIPLDKIIVKLKHEKISSQEKTSTFKIDKFSREIEFIGKLLTSEQRTRLLEIANKCPVHNTLR